VQVTWARFTGAFLISLVVCNVVLRPERLRSKRPWLQLARSAILFVSNLMMFFALRFLQLDQTSSILFATPFIVALLAVPLLGERIGPRRWAAIIVGFIGVMIVIRPGLGGIHPAAFLALGSAFTVAIYVISTRVLSHYDSSATTMFYTNVAGTVALTALLPLFWSTPTAIEGALMFAMGAVALLGHYLLIVAHRLAPASVLSPFMYTQLIWMIFYGYAVFSQLPNQWTLIGASVVIASGLYLLYREVKVKGQQAPVSGDPIA
jgi:drug/metabolite transporter (DMT)-like permease